MFKRFSLLLMGVVTAICCNGQILSDKAKISILTCDPGDQLYSVFGHSAIRVCDSLSRIDWVYNYGTFDFDTPNFYLKFAKGDLNYQLSVYKFRYFLPEYFSENRSVIEQELNLCQKDKQLLFDKLNNNALPQNKDYRYDFFFDNCATRIRDQIIPLDNSGMVEFSNVSQGKTFRELYGEYLKHSPWIEFGIHLLLGMKADRQASAFDEMYLPDFLYLQLKEAKILQPDGTKVELVAHESKLLAFDRAVNDTHLLLRPVSILVLFLALVLLLSYRDVKRGKPTHFFDVTFFVLIGMVGLLLGFLWFFTKHSVTDNNLNLLWANPLFLFLVPALSIRQRFKLLFKTLLISLIVTNVCFLAVYWLSVQEFPSGLFLLILAIISRLFVYYKGFKAS